VDPTSDGALPAVIVTPTDDPRSIPNRPPVPDAPTEHAADTLPMYIGDPVVIPPEAVAADSPINPTMPDPLGVIRPVAVVVDDPISEIFFAAVIVPIAGLAVVPVGDSALAVIIIPAEVVALIPASDSATELVADITPLALIADTPANSVPCDDTIAPVDPVADKPTLTSDDPKSIPNSPPLPVGAAPPDNPTVTFVSAWDDVSVPFGPAA
jgi:hypothetical protein